MEFPISEKRNGKPQKPETVDKTATKDVVDKRFGMIAVKNGWITTKQLAEALEIQIKEDLIGKPHRLIGSILFDLGHITTPQIQEALRILEDHS
jgi:hypothetical protein